MDFVHTNLVNELQKQHSYDMRTTQASLTAFIQVLVVRCFSGHGQSTLHRGSASGGYLHDTHRLIRRMRATRRDRAESLSMNLVVSPQMVGARSAIVTELALVRSLLRVSTLMALQMGRAVRLVIATGIRTVIHAITI